jgi:hypothetical protein
LNKSFPIPADAEAALPEPDYSDPALWSPGTRTAGRPLYLAPAASYHCATLIERRTGKTNFTKKDILEIQLREETKQHQDSVKVKATGDLEQRKREKCVLPDTLYTVNSIIELRKLITGTYVICITRDKKYRLCRRLFFTALQ